MNTARRLGTSLVSLASLGLALAAGPALAQGTIKIGEINSYKALPQNLVPYRQGWLLAQEEVNAAGGVLGKKLETVFRDDNANPGDAVRMAEELLARENVDLLSGVTLSHVGLALTDFAKQRKVFFLASGPLSDKVVWENGNRYTYRLRSGTYALATSVVAEAAKLRKKRWALIYPNYEYGQAAVAAFKENLKKAQPDVEFVAEQSPPLGKIDAGAVSQAIADAKPDAIFNVMFGSDLTKLAREGKTRGLFTGREVVSLLTGEPEYLDPLKDDAPAGWIVTGYPYANIDTPEHKAFIAAYQKKYNDYPRLNSVVGYATVKALAAGIQKAGSTDTEKLIAAFKGLEFGTPFGQAVFRPQDNQSTMGIYVGRTEVKDGRGVMPAGTYLDGAKLQPSDEQVRKLRNPS
ncbi:MAG: ABC transporter substrate-binding protein [Variovorax paradoxus]|uniref:ABC transporter substrate-binding protein n=1 Tax=Variovorax paradoxus TaxID=34073 RepID=A0A2W5QFM6_VARPD|nr:MAG: ABC transporter substrate-binding protein [Variovorax paradoxus]